MPMNVSKYLACLFVLVLGLGCAQVAVAQGTDLGTIRGAVSDTSGGAIPNAQVVLLDIATGTSRITTTNAQGEYQMFGLRPGDYKVTVSAPNMGTTDLTG